LEKIFDLLLVTHIFKCGGEKAGIAMILHQGIWVVSDYQQPFAMSIHYYLSLVHAESMACPSRDGLPMVL
jgi:hypothetical protein